MLLLSSADFFKIDLFLKYSSYDTFRVLNGLGLDQDRQNFGPYFGSKLFAKVISR